MAKKPDSDYLDLMSKNSENWKGVIYFNRKDPRLIVPKFNSSMGWTLNFASPYSYLLIVAVILIIAFARYSI